MRVEPLKRVAIGIQRLQPIRDRHRVGLPCVRGSLGG